MKSFLLFFLFSFVPITGLADDFKDFEVIQPKQRVEAPAFTLPDLEGKSISLDSYSGKIILLHFWATWCKNCSKEMASLQKVQQEFKDFIVLTINIDRNGDKELIRQFMEYHKSSLPVLLDTRNQVRKLYEITGVPTTYIIGKQGKFIGKIIGERDRSSPQGLRFVQRLSQ